MRNKKLIALLSVVAVLVVVVIACGATFLVREVDAYSYYGFAENGAVDYDKAVIDASGIEKHSSMFFLDETEVKNRVESKLHNVGVVNVERKFPDRVVVNYVVYEQLFQYLNGGKYYYCYSSGRIGGSSEAESVDKFTVKPKGVTATESGLFFQPSGSYDRRIVDELIKFMYSAGYRDVNIGKCIRFVDLRRDGYVYIRTEGGLSIELNCNVNNFSALLERGWSIYLDAVKPDSKIDVGSGLIRVWEGSKGINSTYTAQGAPMGETTGGEKKYYSDAVYYAENYDA